MYTVFSSFAFGAVAIHLLHAHEMVQFHLFFILAQLSIFNHATLDRAFRGKRIFQLADKAVIAMATLNGAHRVIHMMQETHSVVPALIYMVAFAWMVHVFSIAKLSFLPGNAWKPWHASLHLAVCGGHHAIIAWHQFVIAPTHASNDPILTLSMDPQRAMILRC